MSVPAPAHPPRGCPAAACAAAACLPCRGEKRACRPRHSAAVRLLSSVSVSVSVGVCLRRCLCLCRGACGWQSVKANQTLCPPGDKKAMQKIMPFLAWVKDEVKERGPSAMELGLGFDELAVLEESKAYIARLLAIPEDKVRFVSRGSAAGDDAEAAAKAVPGKPASEYSILRADTTCRSTLHCSATCRPRPSTVMLIDRLVVLQSASRSWPREAEWSRRHSREGGAAAGHLINVIDATPRTLHDSNRRRCATNSFRTLGFC